MSESGLATHERSFWESVVNESRLITHGGDVNEKRRRRGREVEGVRTRNGGRCEEWGVRGMGWAEYGLTGRSGGMGYCLWRRASKRRMAAETETLRESRDPSIGMRMWASAALRQMSVRPVDSVPITMAVGFVIFVS